MKNTINSDLMSRIQTALYNDKWLDSIGLEKNMVIQFIESENFKTNVDSMLYGNNYSCKSTLSLCEYFINSLCNDNPPKDWLLYIYQYALSKSFPAAVTTTQKDIYIKPCLFYLELLSVISEYQKHSIDATWQSKYPIEFLSIDEEAMLEDPSEYKRFINAFNTNYIYEMMKLNQEIMGYNTLDHICGVHYLALFIGRQLQRCGLPIDLGRVSGSAAGHDIGKYGCIGAEAKRVPYLHYYYSDIWFKQHNITYIRHIAVNHSTWDLELENLPIESLILIYADFRVKNNRIDGIDIMHIYNLQDSFDVILNKLDNVDDTKTKRYKRVYSKLKDFENYLKFLKIETDPTIELPARCQTSILKHKINYSMLQGQSIVNHVKYLSINHNINLMYKLRDEISLNSILELARSESDWKNLREYLYVLQEYSTYLTQRQKLITIKFLYEQLINPEDDIRRQCAELIGSLISMFDEEYRKEVPENANIQPPEITSYALLDEYMDLFICPDHKIIPKHREWIGYSLSIMLCSVFSKCSKTQVNNFSKVVLPYFKKNYFHNSSIELYLLETTNIIPVAECTEDLSPLLDFLSNMLKEQNHALRLSAYEVLWNLLPDLAQNEYYLNSDYSIMFSNLLTPSSLPIENFLKLKIAKLLEYNASLISDFEHNCSKDSEKTSDIFLNNLKTATDWIIKKIHIELLLDHALKNPKVHGFYTAMHFCNLLKVSAVEGVRNRAGEALVTLIPLLSLEQRNDVAVELLRALEIEGYHFTKYIPEYLGKIILYLQPKELDEIIDDLYEKVKSSSPQLVSLLLNTIGVALEHYNSYKSNFFESEYYLYNRMIKLLGIILNGLVNYDSQVKQIAFSVIGKNIFKSGYLNLYHKNEIFKLIVKKMLTLLTDSSEEQLMFLTNSAVLNHIYRFISDFNFFHKEIEFLTPKKIAFFPGAFDPFSQSHKEITKSIRDMGFEVYLQVDEFSWSKQVHPNLIRRNIINMSIADELDIYLYPEDYPTNISNPIDLKKLRNNFPDSEVYIVVGSDVIENASSYKATKSENSIHTFSHIVFSRKSNNGNSNTMNSSNKNTNHSIGTGTNTNFKSNVNINVYNDAAVDVDQSEITSNSAFTEALKKIDGHVVILSLQPRYEDISSTQIRNYIDDNRDISNLVDPLAQKFIYGNGLYKREPQYKTLLQTTSLAIEIVDEFDQELIYEISDLFRVDRAYIIRQFKEFWEKLNPRFLIIRDQNQNNRILGFSAFHWIRSNTLFNEIQDHTVSEYIRENAVGRIIHIDGIFTSASASTFAITDVNSNINFNPDITTDYKFLEQIILTETLAFSLAKDYDYAVFRNIVSGYYSDNIYELLSLHGFEACAKEKPGKPPVYVVNMDHPCIISMDLEAFIKDPFISMNVKRTIETTRKKLQRALSKLYPGHLILAFNRQMLYETVTRKVCKENGVSTIQTHPRILGPAMCVPFGSILKRNIIPNTVTKSLHTEKFFNPDLKSYKINAYPNYLNLENQVKMIHSFNRPVILVDDLLHKGYRIKALDPLLKRENIKVQKIITGVLSGRGKELMDMQHREVDSAYFIPKLRVWFNESLLYPFVGGDILWRGTYSQNNLVPSVNLIFPYSSASFVRGTTKSALYNLSQVCIENAVEIISALEKEYDKLNERNLTLLHLSEVFISPKCPDHGKDMYYDLNLSPTNYLLNDLELLKRLETIIK